VVIYYRRFGTTYPLPSSTLKIGPIGGPEKSVINYHYSLRNNPEERSSHLLRDGSLKSRNGQSVKHSRYWRTKNGTLVC